MKLKRWNYRTAKYDEYEVPDNWSVHTFVPDLDTFVDCAHCGKGLPFGLSMTSFEIHSDMGFGFAVCPNCYDIEVANRYSRK